ncbi:unnamed protein product [Blepharisma stoltei]|uniref:Uncharacterized protein n=1 Tax=Blepharisma stoltei TaxID=1481888 RepID=A0AAU9ITG2_9CILI|nr:unnamed protein product [Blepharisma stoltei]
MILNNSISFSPKTIYKRSAFQAGALNCDSETDACNKVEFLKSQGVGCTWAAISYKTPSTENFYEEETGAGEKLLTLINRMGIKNIVLGVRIWKDGDLPQHDIYRIMIAKAKELIVDLFSKTEKDQAIPQISRLKQFTINFSQNIESSLNSSKIISSTREQTSRLDFDKEKIKLHKVLLKITDLEIKQLREYMYHPIISKILLALLCLIQKSKPNNILLKNLLDSKSPRTILLSLDPSNLSKIQIKRANNILDKIGDTKPSNLSKISHCGSLLLQYVQTVLSLTSQQIFQTQLNFDSSDTFSFPSIHKNIKKLSIDQDITKTGAFLPSKQMVFSFDADLKPQEIPEPSESEEEIPEPTGAEALRDLSKQCQDSGDEGEYLLDENEQFLDERFKQARIHRLEEEKLIKKLLKKDKEKINAESSIPENLTEEDIVGYLKTEKLDNQPLEFLLKFVDKLREKRENHTLG